MDTGSRTLRTLALDVVKRGAAGLGLFLVLAVTTPMVAAAATPTPSPTPPELNPPPGFQMPSHNVIIGIIAVALFVIVYYGRKIRAQRKKDGGGGA